MLWHDHSREAHKGIKSDKFVLYNSTLFTPDSGLSYAASQATKQGHVAWRSAEHKLQNQTNIVEELEASLGIEMRWTPQSTKYQDILEYAWRRQFIHAVEDLEGLVVQQLFELSKANLSLMGKLFLLLDAMYKWFLGYKLCKQISKAIVKRSAAIQSALEKYNKLAVKQHPPQPTLQYNEVTSYVSLGNFNLLKHSQHDVLAKPWVSPTHREMIVKYFKLLRAREEIERLNVEIPRLHAWVDAEDLEMQKCITRLQSSAPLLAAEISAVCRWQQWVNDLHHTRLAQIYNLTHYDGPIHVEVLEEVEDDVQDKGDEAIRFEACMERMDL